VPVWLEHAWYVVSMTWSVLRQSIVTLVPSDLPAMLRALERRRPSPTGRSKTKDQATFRRFWDRALGLPATG
jgi:hypothetical protein